MLLIIYINTYMYYQDKQKSLVLYEVLVVLMYDIFEIIFSLHIFRSSINSTR